MSHEYHCECGCMRGEMYEGLVCQFCETTVERHDLSQRKTWLIETVRELGDGTLREVIENNYIGLFTLVDGSITAPSLRKMVEFYRDHFGLKTVLDPDGKDITAQFADY